MLLNDMGNVRIDSKILSYVYLLNICHEDGEGHSKEQLNKEQSKEDVRYVEIPLVNKPSLGEGMVQQVSATVFYHQTHWMDTLPLQVIKDELFCMFYYCSISFIIWTLHCFACTYATEKERKSVLQATKNITHICLSLSFCIMHLLDFTTKDTMNLTRAILFP